MVVVRFHLELVRMLGLEGGGSGVQYQLGGLAVEIFPEVRL